MMTTSPMKNDEDKQKGLFDGLMTTAELLLVTIFEALGEVFSD